MSHAVATSPDPQRRQQSHRYQTLDCWRGFTCILLVIYHSTMHVPVNAELDGSWLNTLGRVILSATKHLNVGVPIFFVISGYCIFATLDARYRAGEGFGAYFRRRFLRIYPPFWMALATSAVVIWISECFFFPGLFTRSSFNMTAPDHLTPWEWLGNLSLIESWRYHLMGGEVNYLVGHTWTLCYEEQFYAVAGLILCFVPSRMFLAAFLLTVSIPFLRVWGHLNGIHFEGTIIGGEGILFSAGIAAYFANHYAGSRGRKIVLTLLAMAIFLPVFDFRRAILSDSQSRFSWVIAMLSAYLISSLQPYDHLISSWRALRPFRFFGRICYSLYLIHPLVTTGVGHAFYRSGVRGHWETLLIAVPISVALSIVAGTLFFILVERFFLNSNSAAVGH